MALETMILEVVDMGRLNLSGTYYTLEESGLID